MANIQNTRHAACDTNDADPPQGNRWNTILYSSLVHPARMTFSAQPACLSDRLSALFPVLCTSHRTTPDRHICGYPSARRAIANNHRRRATRARRRCDVDVRAVSSSHRKLLTPQARDGVMHRLPSKLPCATYAAIASGHNEHLRDAVTMDVLHSSHISYCSVPRDSTGLRPST